MKKCIIPTLLNTKNNLELLKSVPHREIADISVVYRFVVGNEDGASAAIITKEALEQMGLSFEQMEALGRENFELYYTPELFKVKENVWVLSNRCRIFGASGLLYKHVLRDIADRIGDRFFAVPISVHEIMIVPVKGSDLKTLKEVLCEGNRDLATDDSFLSENIYIYDPVSDRLDMV